MCEPRQSHWQMLRKIGRYLVGAPRLIMRFPWQARQSVMTTYTDSDWAGCVKTARSTSGGIVTIGAHMIKSYSRQQKVVALSSAEAELYATVAASAEGLAFQAYANDLGMAFSGEVYTDSSAALGILQRTGLGKVRHLRTQGLWLQEVRSTKRLTYKKALSNKNPADMLTKHMSAELLSRHMAVLGAELRGGRAETAPQLNSVESVVASWTEPLKGESGARKVHFARTIQVRPIPHTNKGRKCDEKNKKKWQVQKPKARATIVEAERRRTISTPKRLVTHVAPPQGDAKMEKQ